MKLGSVLRKERERKSLSLENVSADLGLSLDEYRELESGESKIEEWGPKLGQIAIQLSIPTSRLISQNGKAAQASQEAGQCGKLIRAHREKRLLSADQMAQKLGISLEDLVSIEEGESSLEIYGPLLLRFSEIINQPIFNLFYPCGLPLDKLEDYA